MLIKLLKTASIAFLLLWSTTLYADKVTVSTDGTGDFLIAPIYIAKGDICSEIKVFNTNETSSILAKVVLRESIASQELDLPIFLSPGDAWAGKVCQVNNRVILTSTDDSNHPAAKKTLKMGKELPNISKKTDFSKGYVEIYPIAQYYEGSKKKVNKSILVERWNMLVNGKKSDPKLSKIGIDSYSLSGLVSFQTKNQETSSIPMTAFKGAHDKLKSGEVINYSSQAKPEILLGKWKVKSILKLLQSKSFSLSYDKGGKDQYINILFPFSYKSNQSRKYKFTVRDMNENKYTMVFSPKLAVKNEVALISVEDLIKLSKDTKKYDQGMIQITAITNNDNIQLGKNKTASIIPTLSRISEIEGKDIMINTIYLPTKKQK